MPPPASGPHVEPELPAPPGSPISDLRPPTIGVGLVLFLLFFQFWSRYVPSPWAVFVVDDWTNWARSLLYSGPVDALRTGLQDPNRPISMAAVETLFGLFGRDARLWTLVSVAGNSLLMLGLAGMAWELTRRRSVVLLAGVLFALWPNLTETYHWSTQVLNEVSCALVWYGLSGWLWIAHVRRGGGWRLTFSALTYLVALFSYEAGILLPAAYLALLSWRRHPIASAAKMTPFAGAVLLYAAWRMTDAFGMNETWIYPVHMQAGLSLADVLWNAKSILHGWVGDRMFGSVLNGLQSFGTLSPWVGRGMIFGNIAAVALLFGIISRARIREGEAPAAAVAAPAFGFVLLWIAAAFAIPLVSYTAPRLNVLPAMGISLLLALLLGRFPLRNLGLLLAVPAILALASNQGTAEAYRQTGIANACLFDHLQRTEPEWRDRDILLIETRGIRDRLTPGLLPPSSRDQRAWAQYGNALLFRGFAAKGMVQAITREPRIRITVINDVEYGARIEGDTLLWHERYREEQPHQQSPDKVFVVDWGSVLWDVQ